MTAIVQLPSLKVEKENTEENLRKLLHAVKPDWPRDEEIKTKSLSGGYSCVMYKCHLDSNPEDAVTVRIAHHLENAGATSQKFERKVLQEANELGYCPKILAMFENGYAYEFVKGEPILDQSKPECIITEEMTKAAAYRLADIHSLWKNRFETEEMTFFKTLSQMVNTSYTLTSDNCPSKESFLKEIDILRAYSEQSGSPLVLCHGDPHPGNIIWNESEGEATFVDWELTQVMYRAYDLCYYLETPDIFGEYLSFPVRRPKDVSQKVCRFYLEKQKINQGQSDPRVDESEIEKLQAEISKMPLLVFLFFLTLNVAHPEIVTAGGLDVKKDFDFSYYKYIEEREAVLGSKIFGEQP